MTNKLLALADRLGSPEITDLVKSITSLASPHPLSPELRALRGQLRMAIRDGIDFHLTDTLDDPEFMKNLVDQLGQEKVSDLQILIDNGDFKAAMILLGLETKTASLYSSAAAPQVQLKGQISANDLVDMDYDVLSALKDAIVFDLILEKSPDGKGNTVIAIPKIHDKWTDGLNLGDISKTPGLSSYIESGKMPPVQKPIPTKPVEKIVEKTVEKTVEKPKIEPRRTELLKREENTEEKEKTAKINELATLLVKMADKYDNEGDFETAAEIDDVLKSLATRPKAPLKNLDDNVRKNLIVFIDKADKNIKDSIDGLNEFFRRLRYFDIVDSIKELGLNDVVEDMQETESCLSSAVKKFYEITHGRRPGKGDIEKLLEKTEKEGDEQDCQNPLGFFESQNVKDENKKVIVVEDSAKDEEQMVEDDCDDVTPAELDDFWK